MRKNNRAEESVDLPGDVTPLSRSHLEGRGQMPTPFVQQPLQPGSSSDSPHTMSTTAPTPPDPAREASITYILDEGFTAPLSIWHRARRIAEGLGLRFVFWDTAYSLIFAGLTVAVVALVVTATPEEWRYTVAAACSPLLFLLITLMTEVVERATSMYDLKQTSHFTIRQITALRIMAYSLVGAVFATVVAVLAAHSAHEVASLLPLSLAVLFLCATLEISTLQLTRNPWAVAVFTALWLTVSLGLPLRYKQDWEGFLANLSVAITGLIALVSLGILVWQISRMLNETRKYAVAY